MKTADLTKVFLVDQSPLRVYKDIKNVRGWWSENITGKTEKPNDEFVYQYKDLHFSKQILIEDIPGKKVVWLVTEGYLSFVNEKDEWKGTKIVFEIIPKGKKTELRFMHVGLTPQQECFEACVEGWTYYLMESLYHLINSGKGQPARKEKLPKMEGVIS